MAEIPSLTRPTIRLMAPICLPHSATSHPFPFTRRSSLMNGWTFPEPATHRRGAAPSGSFRNAGAGERRLSRCARVEHGGLLGEAEWLPQRWHARAESFHS